jgi:hypothetical protein
VADDKHRSARYDELVGTVEKPGSMTHDEIMRDPSILDSPLEAEKARAMAPKTPAQAVAQRRDDRSLWQRFDQGVGKVLDATGIGGYLEGVNNQITYGAWPAIQRALGTDPDAFTRNSPTARSMGEGTGLGMTMLATGGGAAIPKVAAGEITTEAPMLYRALTAPGAPVAAVESKVAQEIAKRIPAQTIPRIARAMPSVVSGAMAGTAQGGLSGGLAGAAGAAIGHATVGLAGEGANKLLRRPNTMTGKYVKALEESAPFRSTPEYKQVDEGMSGIMDVAQEQGAKLGEVQQGRLGAANQAIEQAEEAIPGIDELQPMASVHRDLNRTIKRYSNTNPVDADHADLVERVKANLRNVTRQRIDPVLESDLQTNVKPTYYPNIGGKQAEAQVPITAQGWQGKYRPGSGGAYRAAKNAPGMERDYSKPVGFEPDPSRPGDEMIEYKPGEKVTTAAATPRDLLMQRRQLRKQAEFGMPRTPENAAAREAYQALNDVLHNQNTEWGRQLKAMDSAYAGELKQISRGNEMLFNSGDARFVTDSAAARVKAGDVLSQSLGDTKAAGRAMWKLKQLRSLGPQYEEPIRNVAGKIADEATKPAVLQAGTFSHSGNWPMQRLIQNSEFAKVRLAEPMTRELAGTGGAKLGVGSGLALRNPADAVAARTAATRNDQEETLRRLRESARAAGITDETFFEVLKRGGKDAIRALIE